MLLFCLMKKWILNSCTNGFLTTRKVPLQNNRFAFWIRLSWISSANKIIRLFSVETSARKNPWSKSGSSSKSISNVSFGLRADRFLFVFRESRSTVGKLVILQTSFFLPVNTFSAKLPADVNKLLVPLSLQSLTISLIGASDGFGSWLCSGPLLEWTPAMVFARERHLFLRDWEQIQ